jgi:hypothetical protein
MKQFPGRSVWLVETPDLEPGQRLVIAFGEGVLMACLSANPYAISEVLGAYDGTVRRLLDAEPVFARFAGGDDRRVPDRFWLRDESDWAPVTDPGLAVDLPVLRGDAIVADGGDRRPGVDRGGPFPQYGSRGSGRTAGREPVRGGVAQSGAIAAGADVAGTCSGMCAMPCG